MGKNTEIKVQVQNVPELWYQRLAFCPTDHYNYAAYIPLIVFVFDFSIFSIFSFLLLALSFCACAVDDKLSISSLSFSKNNSCSVDTEIKTKFTCKYRKCPSN